jgi:hypothetical protein
MTSPALAVSIERIDRAIGTVARMMVKHDMPQLILTIRALEAERDRMLNEIDSMEYARRILRKAA